MSFLVLDIENDSSSQYDRKAGNFLFDPIVAIGLCNEKETRSEYIYPNKIKELKIDEDVIVGFNIKHDLLFLWHLDTLQDFFKRGGRVWDVQYAEYILSGHQHKYPSLRDIAVSEYGCQDRRKFINDFLFHREEYIEQLIPIPGVMDSTEMLAHIEEIREYKQVSDIRKCYVKEDVENDVKDTASIYLQQLGKAEELGMIKVLELEMDAILATCEMEYNGLHIDPTVLKVNKKQLELELKAEREKLQELVRPYWIKKK